MHKNRTKNFVSGKQSVEILLRYFEVKSSKAPEIYS